MRNSIVALALLALAAGCAEETTAPAEEATPDASAAPETPEIASNPLRDAYFGDTHIHTVLSFDAYLMGTRRTPDEAYAFAKGEAIEHAAGRMMQLHAPLDFLAVSDHAFYLGMMRELADEDSAYGDHPVAPAVRAATNAAGSSAGFQAVVGHLREGMQDPDREDDLDDRDVARSAWQEIIESAERNNDPGNFTTFTAYEYTSSGPEGQNLHRNVVFRGDAPAQPFSRLDSLNPEDLWAWMDATRTEGMDAIAIPHNSNGSDGWMFRDVNWAEEPLDAAYADLRMRNEPLVENTQVKGTSDTHPLLSPNDEWADFELMELKVASDQASRPPGSYVRDAYLNGLAMEATQGFNPYRFGVIGASDTHNAAGSFYEYDYWSKTGFTDIEPYMRGSVPLPEPAEDGAEYADGSSQYWGASGLAGVWAESNTREAIFDAMRRKETFSTSGPRIKVRFFGGYGLDNALAEAPDSVAQAYASGVPMGADLAAGGEGAPSFYASALRDPNTVGLQRLQIIKGWIEDGERQEAVIDIACSDGGAVDPESQRCPDNGATVDLATCDVSEDKGAGELAAVWQDPDFDPAQHAFYYVRVLENPKCRWSTWDAIREGVPLRPDMHATVQDRAWSSPIWYRPG